MNISIILNNLCFCHTLRLLKKCSVIQVEFDQFIIFRELREKIKIHTNVYFIFKHARIFYSEKIFVF